MVTRIRTAVGWLLRCCVGTAAAESYRLQLPVSAGPNAETDREGRARHLEAPPEEIGGKGTGVDCGDDEMQKMDGKSEIRHEFRSRYKEQERYNTIEKAVSGRPPVSWAGTGKYLINPTSNQTSPSVHPIVLSPRILFQSKMRLTENFCPATSAVKSIKTKAAT
jgi:hypothetical protein